MERCESAAKRLWMMLKWKLMCIYADDDGDDGRVSKTENCHVTTRLVYHNASKPNHHSDHDPDSPLLPR